jgi:hypothetical protein
MHFHEATELLNASKRVQVASAKRRPRPYLAISFMEMQSDVQYASISIRRNGIASATRAAAARACLSYILLHVVIFFCHLQGATPLPHIHAEGIDLKQYRTLG